MSNYTCNGIMNNNCKDDNNRNYITRLYNITTKAFII